MISCCCTSYEADTNIPTVLTTNIRKARKEHKCCECNDNILRDELYEYVTGCWDGSWSTFKTCTICAAIRETFFGQCGWTYGALVRDFLECYEWDYRKVPTEGEK